LSEPTKAELAKLVESLQERCFALTRDLAEAQRELRAVFQALDRRIKGR